MLTYLTERVNTDKIEIRELVTFNWLQFEEKRNTDINADEILLRGYIGYRSKWGDGECFASVETFSRDLKIAENTVRAHLRILLAAKHVIQLKGRSQYGTKVYKLNKNINEWIPITKEFRDNFKKRRNRLKAVKAEESSTSEPETQNLILAEPQVLHPNFSKEKLKIEKEQNLTEDFNNGLGCYADATHPCEQDGEEEEYEFAYPDYDNPVKQPNPRAECDMNTFCKIVWWAKELGLEIVQFMAKAVDHYLNSLNNTSKTNEKTENNKTPSEQSKEALEHKIEPVQQTIKPLSLVEEKRGRCINVLVRMKNEYSYTEKMFKSLGEEIQLLVEASEEEIEQMPELVYKPRKIELVEDLEEENEEIPYEQIQADCKALEESYYNDNYFEALYQKYIRAGCDDHLARAYADLEIAHNERLNAQKQAYEQSFEQSFEQSYDEYDF